MFNRKDVRLCQVADVNIIPDASSVFGWVIVAEEGNGCARLDGTQNQGDQVGFRFVAFTQSCFRFCSAGIEVPRANATKLLIAIEPLEHLLDNHLRLAIRVYGS